MAWTWGELATKILNNFDAVKLTEPAAVLVNGEEQVRQVADFDIGDKAKIITE